MSKHLAQPGTRLLRCGRAAVTLVALFGACADTHEGSPADAEVAATAPFHIRYDSEVPVLDVITDPVYRPHCFAEHVRYEAKRDDRWVALRDERSMFLDVGYYLGSSYVAPLHHEGCDPAGCTRFIQGETLPRPEEYVRTGSMPAPDAGPADPLAVVIERRTVTEPLRARIRYFRDESCQTPLEELIDLR